MVNFIQVIGLFVLWSLAMTYPSWITISCAIFSTIGVLWNYR
jgi:hypothetical protein